MLVSEHCHKLCVPVFKLNRQVDLFGCLRENCWGYAPSRLTLEKGHGVQCVV